MTSKQRKRHEVLPGLTGLAQVNGRNKISWEEKFYWDLQYLHHIGLRTDMAIVGKTRDKVLRKRDITSEGLETAEDLGDYLLRTGRISAEEYRIKKDMGQRLIKGR